jgi:hypothetical protein
LNKPIDIGTKFRDKIVNRYPTVDGNDMPVAYSVIPTNYRNVEIENYHVIFWHRLLRNIYGEPLSIEAELISKNSEDKIPVQTAFFRRTSEKNNWEVDGMDVTIASAIEAGKIKPFPINWKYLIKLPSGGMVELGTKDKNTIFNVTGVIASDADVKYNHTEANKLIDLLLEEANRQKGQLLNPTKEFEKREGIRLYLLFNVYLSNYLSGKNMLDIAEVQEANRREGFLKYDARTSDLYDEEKRKHIDLHMLTCGMFYCSAITYFFVAFEGFVNLIFHAFLKNRFRDKEFRTEQRLDLEQKLRFMPSLCKGFNEDSQLPSTIIVGFKKLKNYRNSLFHSNVEDSLKSLCFVEQGFVYTYDMDDHKDRFLPAHKIKLTIEDVNEVKSIVDEMVNNILNSMDSATRKATETYILKEPHIPFQVSASGDLVIGKDPGENL